VECGQAELSKPYQRENMARNAWSEVASKRNKKRKKEEETDTEKEKKNEKQYSLATR
jgi:hypothetical protein